MASTNKTTNLQLSQFVGTDVPTWLGDYNGDMQKIDDAIFDLIGNVSNNDSAVTLLRQLVETKFQGIQAFIDGFEVEKHNVVMSPNITGNTGAYVSIYSTTNKKFVQLSAYGGLPSSQGSAVGMINRGQYYYLPIFSCTDNCLGLSVGDVGTGYNVYRVGITSLRFSREILDRGTTPAYSSVWVVAVWNGTQTVYYLRLDNLNVQLSTNNTFDCEITTINKGNYDG